MKSANCESVAFENVFDAGKGNQICIFEEGYSFKNVPLQPLVPSFSAQVIGKTKPRTLRRPCAGISGGNGDDDDDSSSESSSGDFGNKNDSIYRKIPELKSASFDNSTKELNKVPNPRRRGGGDDGDDSDDDDDDDDDYNPPSSDSDSSSYASDEDEELYIGIQNQFIFHFKIQHDFNDDR